MKKALFFLSCGLSALSYETERNVLKLGQSDFDQALQEYPDMLVKFYAPWCGHCKTLAPAYLDAADELTQIGSSVKLAQVDCTIHGSLCQKYEIKGYPTLNFFSKGSTAPTKYSGSRAKEALVSWVTEKVPVPVKSEEEIEEPKQENKVETPQFETDGKVLKLTAETFKLAKETYDYLFVKFYAPWCGHCKNMGETWKQLAESNTDSKLAIAEVDCTVHSPVCSENQVKGYPTLKLFAKGNEPVPYKGARNIETFTSFLTEQKASLVLDAVPEKVPEPSAEEL